MSAKQLLCCGHMWCMEDERLPKRVGVATTKSEMPTTSAKDVEIEEAIEDQGIDYQMINSIEDGMWKMAVMAVNTLNVYMLQVCMS